MERLPPQPLTITALKGPFTGAHFTPYIMFSCQQKITRQSTRPKKKKKKKTHTKKPNHITVFEETQQASESHSDSAEILELLDHEFKTTVINTLRALTVKVDNTPKQMGNLSRETEILRNNLFKKQIENCNRNEECFPWAHQLTGLG